MEKRGFEFLTTRTLENTINLDEYESKFAFELPQLFKLFYSTFLTGKNYSLKNDIYYDSRFKDYYSCSGAIYYPLQNNEIWFISVSYFYDIEQIYNDWYSFLQYEEGWTNYKFLKIADIGRGGGLYISTKSEDADNIYIIVWDNGEPYFAAKNIFEFMKGFVEFVPEEKLQTGIKISQLYRNFGENFWRIKKV
ncbi:MAG: hypothetical protein LBT27_09680 [Prevotellaceae bacterium]|jgi:hypothetical protein|nr:hypothetical protein [Prevotellaceae bacterium]